MIDIICFCLYSFMYTYIKKRIELMHVIVQNVIINTPLLNEFLNDDPSRRNILSNTLKFYRVLRHSKCLDIFINPFFGKLLYFDVRKTSQSNSRAYILYIASLHWCFCVVVMEWETRTKCLVWKMFYIKQSSKIPFFEDFEPHKRNII